MADASRAHSLEAVSALPNIVIAGAPKCGTSSVFNWLADHPAVCGSDPKETFYLMDAGHPLRRSEANVHDHGLNKYPSFFEHCSGEAHFRLEATTHYLYQRTARRVLSRRQPPPHVIVLLRKPSARVHSSYRYTVYNLANLDASVSFAQYVRAVLQNRADELKPHFSAVGSSYVLRRDVAYSRYVTFLTHWAEQFPRERLHVRLFENMRARPRPFLKELAASLGLDASFYDDYAFDARNETTAVRWPAVHDVAKWVATQMRDSWLQRAARTLYLKIQSRERRLPDEQTREALAALDRHFEPYNEKLADAFALDLSPWETEPSFKAKRA